ncbi:nucleoside triphosphate pyrophosphohydrolase family protein [Bdellovibrio sp. 22V]|uniref:nucleoside triphosphate pyrophosphohydrolase family protein n=1 Tax=Bdellovibrio sp. 22V TaxID=3044166 RepID=UPI002543AF89|nr:nucleoside triphosphate pyrophosphohydrolase family protein [Bdellovibrio sp. 22V]WII71740.1 nucleoside triphosphate pyrophosphohydrolase family protein [Bdellovibrio sp. 22V]
MVQRTCTRLHHYERESKMKFIDSYNIECKDALHSLNCDVTNAISFTLRSSETNPDITSKEMFYTVKELHNQIVKDLFRPMESRQDELLHAVVGIGGEAGELLDCVKKHVYYDKPLDVKNILEEAGDVLFYLKAMLMLIGMDITDVEAYNFKKLSARYPDGKFTTLHAAARLDKAEEEKPACEHRNVLYSVNGAYCPECGNDVL